MKDIWWWDLSASSSQGWVSGPHGPLEGTARAQLPAASPSPESAARAAGRRCSFWRAPCLRLQTTEPQPPAGALLRDRAWLLRTQAPEPGHTAPDSDLSQTAYHATTHFPHVQSGS